MTEDDLERRVEARMNHLDKLLMSGKLTQREYDQRVATLDAWAASELARVQKVLIDG